MEKVKQKYKLERISFAAPKKWLMTLLKELKAQGYDVQANWQRGTVEGKLDDQIIFRAIEVRKGFWYTKGAPEVFSKDDGDVTVYEED